MLPSLHVPTLYALLAAVCLAMALSGVFVRRTSGRVAGLDRLSAGAAVLAVGLALETGALGAAAGPILGNPLVTLGFALVLSGTRAFYGLSPRDPLMWLAVACVAVAAVWFYVVVPSLRARVVIVNTFSAALLLRAGWVAFHAGRRVDGAPAVLVGLSLAALGATTLGRALHGFLGPDAAALARDQATVLLLVAGAAAAVGLMLGVVSGVNQRLLRASEHAHASLEQLVEVTAHELRSPLTSILGALEVIYAVGPRGLDPKGLVPIALRNAERMQQLIDELLDLETLEAGKGGLRFESVEIGPFVRNVLELNEPYGTRFGVHLVSALDPRSTHVRADPARLSQVFTNLLSNAIKHSPPGATVRLSTATCPLGVRFEVADAGPGIPAELRDRLFERFARGPGQRADVRSTGLGLAITRSIVEASGGRIGFESAEGQGTTFHVELPTH